MRFKLWLQQENLSPGGGGTLDDPHADMEARARDDAKKGVGAHFQGGDNPPRPMRTATFGYEDQRFCRKAMKKMMKKKMKKI
jgi:hypothetical protein